MCLHTLSRLSNTSVCLYKIRKLHLQYYQSHLLGYSQKYYLVLSLCVHSFHEEMLGHREYPTQVAE